jgi:peptidoglycan hydrolase CwlO-like protein
MSNIIEEIKKQYEGLLQLLTQVQAEVTAVPDISEPDLSFLKGLKEKLEAEETRLRAQQSRLEEAVGQAETALESTEEALETIENLVYELESLDV